jgi:Spy/CpxP family protein refolding chaperone
MSVCFGVASLFLTTVPVLASDSNNEKLKSKNKLLISDNSNYDGASLPPPVKKKNQVTVGGDEPQDDVSSRKSRRKRFADVDTDPMSTPDTAGGITVPVKKSQKFADLSGKGPGDRDGHAGGPGGPGGDRRGHHDHDPLFGRGPLDLTPLGLTDDQKQKIAQMRAENGIKMRDLMKKRHELSGQMRDTMFGADVTEAQIKAKRDEVRQVQEKLEDLRLNDFLAIRAILTPEQKLKLKDVKIVEGRPPRDGEGPPGQPLPKRADGDTKRLADTPTPGK